MSRIVESLYGKYGLNEARGLSDKILTTIRWFGIEGIQEFLDDLEDRGLSIVDIIDTPDYEETAAIVFGDKQAVIRHLVEFQGFDEEEAEEIADTSRAKVSEAYKLREARNPENDEVNAIIRKHLQHKSSIKPAEQKVLDKYGITYNADDKIFKGPNGKKIGWESEDGERGIWGPRASYTDRTGRRRKNWGYIDKQSPEYSEVDYANYLTKEADPDAAFYNQSKTERDINLSSRYGKVETPSMQKANRPYSPEYKKIKSKLDQEQHWLDMQKEDQAEAENRYYKDLKRYRQALQRDIDRERERTQKFQADYDTVAKEMDDFRNSLPKRNKNESLNRRNKKFLKEGMFDDIAEDLGYTIYDEDQYGTMYTKTHYVNKNGEEVEWTSTIEVVEVDNDDYCYVDIYDENGHNVGNNDFSSFRAAAEYADKVVEIKPNNPYATIYESCNKKNRKRRRR